MPRCVGERRRTTRGARVRRYATDPESIRHEEALRALAVANLRAWTASRPGDEIDVMSFEVDAVVGHLVDHPDELAGFLEETAIMLGSLYVQLAEAVGLTRSDAVHLARKRVDPM